MTKRPIVGVTGTRNGPTGIQLVHLGSLLSYWNPIQLHHGDCVGVDDVVHDLAEERGLYIVVHPPSSSALRAARRGNLTMTPRPYLERDRALVDACDLLIAVPATDELHASPRSGTWYTIRYARTVGRPTYVVLPDGTVIVEDGTGEFDGAVGRT